MSRRRLLCTLFVNGLLLVLPASSLMSVWMLRNFQGRLPPTGGAEMVSQMHPVRGTLEPRTQQRKMHIVFHAHMHG